MSNIRYTAREDSRIEELYPDHTVEEISRLLGRTFGSVQGRIRVLGLRKEHPRKKKLSESDLLWLRLNYPNMRNELIALKFGTSKRYVSSLASSMGLRKSEQFIRECEIYMARKGQESNSRALKGVFSENLRKGREIMLNNRKLRLEKKNDTMKY